MNITTRLRSYIPKGDGYNSQYADDLELAAQFIDDVVDAYLKSNDIDMGDHAEVTIEHWEKIRTSCSAALNSEEKQ